MFTNYLTQPDSFKKLNTLSKYPSILTYHEMGKRGCLTPDLSHTNPSPETTIYFTEKVDGTNTRILINGKDFIIGTREELLYAKGDRIVNPAMGVCPYLIPIVETLVENLNLPDDQVMIVYGESYGGKITKASREYTTSQQIGFRVFDIIQLSALDLTDLMAQSVDALALWRDQGKQPFLSEEALIRTLTTLNLERVPSLFTLPAAKLPTEVVATYDFLVPYKETRVGLDHAGKSEGLIARSADRQFIAKLRFEDYERTLKQLRKQSTN